MNIVLDTNTLLVSVSERSKSHWIFEHFLNKKFNLCVTSEILSEYSEIFERHWGAGAASELMEVLDASFNIIRVETYYKWNLIYVDPDDNKFVDCAVACNAKCIVSEDKHFRILETIPFPKIEILNIEEFKLLF